MPLDTDSSTTTGTQVIRRVVALLRLITSNNRKGLRLTDLHRATAIEKPTVHRILQGLITEQMVRQDSATKRYHLGLAMYEMGLAAAPKLGLRDICHPHLLVIADQTGDTVFLTVRSGFDGVCIDRAEGNFPIKAFVLDVGKRRPLTAGGGSLAILSGLPSGEVDRICSINADRMRERYPRYSEAALRRDLDAARDRGYSVKEVLEVPDVRSVAVPIRKPDGTAIAAISVATIATRLNDQRAAVVAGYIAEAVASIEAQLAHQW
ncbi:IclR family transcriptional regulator [Bordetella petrii]|uniref:IclR family transcriptional regulator n=1 Tax=Bordetella petrii TaxID=94624 RepID=UPI001E346125|nr:IclR family transcriptional regulator [Bordetella petrii]MCD0502648.1 IclR family transcriptional regulator [Bordetella petrii]